MSDTLELIRGGRDVLPELTKQVTQIIVDNPGQMALLMAGSIVATRAAVSIVRPRSWLEFLALEIVLIAGAEYGMFALARSGKLPLWMRDSEGNKVRYSPAG